jgi:endogenous inhibitor of DNA gyrase (YacG/DUF329 family)
MPLPKDPINAEETRRKMSEARKGHVTSEETRKKIGEAHKGKIVSEETRQKLSLINKGKKQLPEVTEKIRAANTGKKRSPEFCKHLSEVNKGRKISEESRKKMSLAQKGKKQSSESIAKRVAANTGKQRSLRTNKNCTFCGKEMELLDWEKNRIFCSSACKGKWQSENAVGEKSSHWQGGGITKICEECGKEFNVEKTRNDNARFCSFVCKGVWMSKNLNGENNSNWTGGPKDYCEKWNLEFRRRIRAFFNYGCAECGTPQNEKLFHCHHIYYDKKACCSVNEDGKYLSNLGIKDNPHSFEIIGDPNKFILLCDSCHAKSSGKKKREFWARHFEEIINNYYLGRSYFTKEEYEKIR